MNYLTVCTLLLVVKLILLKRTHLQYSYRLVAVQEQLHGYPPVSVATGYPPVNVTSSGATGYSSGVGVFVLKGKIFNLFQFLVYTHTYIHAHTFAMR